MATSYRENLDQHKLKHESTNASSLNEHDPDAVSIDVQAMGFVHIGLTHNFVFARNLSNCVEVGMGVVRVLEMEMEMGEF